MTSSKERLIHFRTSLNQLGLHDNLTIVNAELKLNPIVVFSGDPVISVHGMEESGLWAENEMTWNQMSPTGFSGTMVGAPTEQRPSLGRRQPNQQQFSFDLNHAVQNYLDGGDEAPLDLMMAVRGKYESYTNNEGIVFHSAEAASSSDAPSFSSRTNGAAEPPPAVTLTDPADGLAVWNQTGHNLSGNTQPSLNWTAPSTGDDIHLRTRHRTRTSQAATNARRHPCGQRFLTQRRHSQHDRNKNPRGREHVLLANGDRGQRRSLR